MAPARAQLITNPGFEMNAIYTVAPGYVSGNIAITGWTPNLPGSVGLNPGSSFSSFADNGTIPQGVRVAFIQSNSNQTTTLSTTITGLTATKNYLVKFRANARSAGTTPLPFYRINGGPAIPFSVSPAGGGNPYATVLAEFTATGTTATLEIGNTSPADSTLLVDDFSVAILTPIVVTSAANDGPGSLRQALIAAAAAPGASVITFAPAMSGLTIPLISEIAVADTGGVFVDASALVAGVTISGNNATRLFNVANGAVFSLIGVTLAAGSDDGGASGGAILNAGTTTLARCTVSGNHSDDDAGAILNPGRLALAQCTFAGNSATNDGGAIRSSGTLRLAHCTFSANTAGVAGGGIRNDGAMALDNSIISGNTSANSGTDGDVVNSGNVTATGANIVVAYSATGTTTGPTPLTADPKLDVLANNGGPTQTIALKPGSAARAAAVGSTISSDQRGKPKVGTADLGAFEIQSGGAFAFNVSGYSANESAGSATVTIVRTGGFDGAASVKIATAAGTAGAADFTAIAAQTVSFADGEISKDVAITLNNDTVPEPNEVLTVTLSAPSGGTLGTPLSATVTIRDDDSAADVTAPLAPVITAPLAGASISVDTNGTIIVSGTAADNRGVAGVQVLDSQDLLLAQATLGSPFAASTTWTATITPVTGNNTIKVVATDGNNSSTATTRTFKVLRPLAIQVAGNGSVSAGFAPASFREVGQKYLITATPSATPAPGSLFQNWTIESANSPAELGIPPTALEKPTITITHREGLVLRANFAPNPYAFGTNGQSPGLGTNSAGVSGVEYNGLIHADPVQPAPLGTAKSNSTEGMITATVMSTGAFSAKLFIDGVPLMFAGAFDATGTARFGTSRATSAVVARLNKPSLIVTLNIDIDAGRSKDTLFGTVSARNFQQSVTQAVSQFTADRAYYDAVTPATTLPAAYLGASNATQSYTAVFPSLPLNVTVTTAGNPDNDVYVPNGTAGAHIIFQGTAPAGLTVGEVYTLVNPHGGSYFKLEDATNTAAPITEAGDFTVTSPEFTQDENTALAAQDYPQGDGYALVTISKSGVVTFVSGKLADGTGIAGSTKVTKENRFPLFLQLYGGKGYLGGDVQLDANNPASDFAAAKLDWSRPFDSTSHYYPFGWEEVIRVGLVGARYAPTFSPASSVLRTPDDTIAVDPDFIGDELLPEDLVAGNAGLSFFDGQLSEQLDRTVSISKANVVTKVPSSDTSFTLLLTAATGAFNGGFVHENDDGGTTTPIPTTFDGVIFQKGPNAGGYGFFLTRKPTPIDYTGESGAVNLLGFTP